MVIYFTPIGDSGVKIYMGRDKYENEELIKYGWPEDIWFHVSNYSSAHVYLRLPEDCNFTIDNIPQDLLNDCLQLVKYNSIQGNKIKNVKIIYTWWSNLKKTPGMADGEVGYHDVSLLYYQTIESRDNSVINRLEKTKLTCDDINYSEIRRQRDIKENRKNKKIIQKQKLKEKELKLKQQQIEEEKQIQYQLLDPNIVFKDKEDKVDIWNSLETTGDENTDDFDNFF